MGADIHGFVECRITYRSPDSDDAAWQAAIDLDFLYGGRDYDAFGCLFGVRNHAGFRPLAASRGLPADVSDTVVRAAASWGSDAHSASWIAWTELAQVDWDEPAEAVDQRVHEYRPGPDGGWLPSGKSFQGREGRSEGEEWPRDGRLFRVARMTRREAVPPDGEWGPVRTAMEALATVHGPENVRLVVWFDS